MIVQDQVEKLYECSGDKPCLLISACLIGVNCRYTGDGKRIDLLDALMDRYHLIPVCPEQLGGLPTPRPPSECRGESVVSIEGNDVTGQFERGAAETLKIASAFNVRACILKERSPSCGSGKIYDGTFTGKLKDGDGKTAAMLKAHGYKVFGESEISSLLQGACLE